jgi:rubrerythrin
MELKQPTKIRLKNGAEAFKGICASCGHVIFVLSADAIPASKVDVVIGVDLTAAMTFPWGNSIPVLPNEKILAWAEKHVPSVDSDEVSFSTWFVVSNQRLILALVELAKGDRRVRSLKMLDLEDVNTVRGDGEVIEVMDKNGNSASFKGEHQRLGELRSNISEAIAKRKSEVKEQQNREQVITTDFSWLRDYMQKGGLLLTTFKCPSCGGNITIPESGGVVKCPFCGSDVHAIDIFKKVKELIG